MRIQILDVGRGIVYILYCNKQKQVSLKFIFFHIFFVFVFFFSVTEKNTKKGAEKPTRKKKFYIISESSVYFYIIQSKIKIFLKVYYILIQTHI